MEKKLFIDCDCGCDILRMEYIEADKYEEAYFWFNMYFSARHSLWTRIKAAIKYLLRGEFAYTEMMIRGRDIDRMINFLMEFKEDNA